MKFDLPKGAIILAKLAGMDENGKKLKRAWRKHVVVDVSKKGHTLLVDIGKDSLTKVSFSSARIDSPAFDPGGHVVTTRFKLSEAAEAAYSVKSLWWASKENRHERVATVLEVWLYKQDFVPYAGWRLIDFEDDSDVRPEKFEEKVWRAPIKSLRSNTEAKEEYFDANRLAQIEKYEVLYKDAKKAARMTAELATKYRLKLATLKRMR